MNIIITRRADIGRIDGVNRFIFTLADGLVKLGHDATIVAHHMSRDPRYIWNDVGKSVDIQVFSNPTSSLLKIMYDWLRRGSRLTNKLDPDAIIVNGVIALRTKAFKIAVNHGDAILEIKDNFVKRFITKKLYNLHSCVICVSNKVKTVWEREGITKCSYVIPIPLKTELYKARPYEDRKNIVLHVGTAERKNVDISIKTVRILNRIGVNIKLVIVGSKHNINEDDNIIVRKDLTSNTLRDLYSQAKVLMMPSSWEGFGYAALEAQASGTPVVVGPGVPDEALIHGKTGFKLHTYNPQDYAEKIKILLSNEGLWNAMSKNGIKFAKTFNYIGIAKRYIKIINKSCKV